MIALISVVLVLGAGSAADLGCRYVAILLFTLRVWSEDFKRFDYIGEHVTLMSAHVFPSPLVSCTPTAAGAVCGACPSGR